jgi:hypothetical protein
MLSYYHSPGARDICHAVKEMDACAIKAMADHLIQTGLATKGSILIPAPQHYGYADYTRKVCDLIASETGSRFADILKCRMHEPLYIQKKNGTDISLGFFLDGNIPAGDLLFVDNVMATGRSYIEARRLIGHGLRPLIYAVDETKCHVPEVAYMAKK